MVMTFICTVLGQIVGALAFDAFGLFGVNVRTVTSNRLSGVLLATAGVILANMKVATSSSAHKTSIEYSYMELPDSCENKIEVKMNE